VKGNPYQTQRNSHQIKIEATQQMHMRDASQSPVKTTSRRSELSRFVEIKQSCEKNAKGLNLMQCLNIIALMAP
jgi:N-formylglutamate amidohydrolase